jgi:aspartyl aminopeptidase
MFYCRAVTADLLAFLRASPTPFHAVAEGQRRLADAGFTSLDETSRWDRLAPGAYQVTTTGTNLFAFVLPEQRTQFRIIGAHTDSPNLRLKPNPEYTTEGYAQLGVEVYGGALLNSWLDRDLGIAGRLLVRDDSGAIASELVCIDRPILRIPQLAIHLDREVNDKGLILNRQDHLAPILGLASSSPGPLAALVAEAAQVAVDRIVGSELMLFDLTAPTLGGPSNEFIFSARLDNLSMCHAAVTAMTRAPRPTAISMIALFDHEEVGSVSAAGAGSAVLPRILERLLPDREAFHQACARSSCISADMAHAVHPNYASRHDPRHKPQLNGGPVIKTNSQQRYATTAATAAMFAGLCRDEGVPVQHYAHRTDLPCGSTIGPITSTLLGIATVDVGNPMLSMHSARELAGSRDPELMTRVLARYLQS